MEENNMHVANLERCKELYEVSGWKDTWFWHCPPDRSNSKPHVSHYIRVGDNNIHAYDLGYLLRKLPPQSNLWQDEDNREWCIQCLASKIRGTGIWTADTPEDAACKLAIELFKQGILSRT